MTTFDLVLLLIISEATQQGLLGDDFSVTNALFLITTLIALDLTFLWLERTFPRVDGTLEGPPLVLVEGGKPLIERMRKARVEAEEVLEQGPIVAGPGAYGPDQVCGAGAQRGDLDHPAALVTA